MGIKVNHFVADGNERCAAVLREQMDGERVVLEAKLSESLSDDERKRIRGEIEELLRKHKEALQGIRYSHF